MYIILGGTGHIGSALARILLDMGEQVTVVTRAEQKRSEWERRGAEVAVIDVREVEALRRVFARGKRAFLLNPPAAPSGDIDVEERRTVQSIVAALEGSGLERVVAQSTYGAQPGRNIGDLGVLYEWEQALHRQPIATTIIRGAYYMSNWDMSLESVRTEGRVYTFFPAAFKLPMVAPHDIAKFAASLLTSATGRVGLHYIEGPEQYSPSDVAAAFAHTLERTVAVETIPQSQWKDKLAAVGFSGRAAESMAAMTRITLNGAETPDTPVRGAATLSQYIKALSGTRQTT